MRLYEKAERLAPGRFTANLDAARCAEKARKRREAEKVREFLAAIRGVLPVSAFTLARLRNESFSKARLSLLSLLALLPLAVLFDLGGCT